MSQNANHVEKVVTEICMNTCIILDWTHQDFCDVGPAHILHLEANPCVKRMHLADEILFGFLHRRTTIIFVRPVYVIPVMFIQQDELHLR